jgi:hypothetical protein
MITVLVVGGTPDAFASLADHHPSIEILAAAGVEDALEKLARNRRIDAVLLAAPRADGAEIARVIREEDPGAPPLFSPETEGMPPGVRTLGGRTPEELLAALVHALSADR